MLRIFRIAWKEVKLVKTQSSSIALTVIYPLLVVLVVAAAFSGKDFFASYFGESGVEKPDVAVYVPQDSANFDFSDFLKRISDFNNISIRRVKTPELAKEAVRSRIARIGFAVGNPSARNEPVDVNLFIDNSSLFGSKSIASQVFMGLENVRYKKSQEIISAIWSDLEWIKSKLNEQQKSVDVFLESIKEDKERMQTMRAKINSIQLAPLFEKVSQFEADYVELKADLNATKGDLEASKSDLLVFSAKMEAAKNRLIQYKAELGQLKLEVANARSLAVGELALRLEKIEKDLDKKIEEIDLTIVEIDSALKKTVEINARIEKASIALASAGTKIDSSKATVEGFNKLLGELQGLVEETNGLMQQGLDSQDKIEADLKRTKELFSSLSGTLAEFQKYDPGFLIAPLRVKEFYLYPSENLSVITPVCLALVLLLTVVLLSGTSVLREREYGVAFRAMLSTTPKTVWLLGKILGQTFFAFFEAAIILFLFFFVFQVRMAGSPLDLILALSLVSFCFASMGVFLANFARTESTLILSSLVVMIPMLFLSGVVFPVEFMPVLLGQFAEFLPLTIAINLFSGVILKGTQFSANFAEAIVLFLFSVALLVFCILRKEA
ncbi:MAG: ABC transporter permease [Candidatus Diapherotrites archaeon]